MRNPILFVALIFVSGLGCNDSPQQTKLIPGVQFEIHSISAQAGNNTRQSRDPISGAPLNLVVPPIITAANVENATIVPSDGGSVGLEVGVDVAGAKKLQAATATTGRQLAIIINGKVAATPTLMSPIDKRFMVTGSLSRSDLEKILMQE